MRRCARRLVWAAILIALTLSSSVQPARAANGAGPQNLHFPTPPLLEPNVAFWKQIYTAYGVGDFVLHDRENLGVLYGVVRVDERANQVRAAELAKPELQRQRGTYQEILRQLATGIPPEALGPAGQAVWQAWGCPCPPEVLRRAADNIRVQQGLRQKVDEGIQRAKKLLPHILAILREHNVPAELAALPLVESSYNPQAYSKAGAAGLWQFIRATGKQYLTITRKRDERRDPLRATDAAAHLLRHNYEALGSWPLAIVAYNHGREGILTARAAVGSDAVEDIIARYSGPRFGFASRNFYAEFLAALEVVQPLLTSPGQPRPPTPAPVDQPVTPEPTTVIPDLPASLANTSSDATKRPLP
jgi:membrane-bound lytic murein transglycosylase D